MPDTAVVENKSIAEKKSIAEQKFYAVVPAAGVGERVGAGKPKQYVCISGLTILEHTINRLLKANIFSEIIVA
ncbi:MAG: 2-C-methyl-D-erythritol 4-phosphate cytidylyltransferase, partial [Pseudohongiellaceae bacterium]